MLLPLWLNLDGTTPPPVGVQEIVPYLIGDSLYAAQMRIASIYGVPSVTGASGTVLSQSPAPFTLVNRGATISITLGGPVNAAKSRRRRGLPPY